MLDITPIPSGKMAILFFLEKVRANCLTTEQRQVWVLGIPFLGETANRPLGTMIQHVLIIKRSSFRVFWENKIDQHMVYLYNMRYG